jgi:hypothetical protein
MGLVNQAVKQAAGQLEEAGGVCPMQQEGVPGGTTDPQQQQQQQQIDMQVVEEQPRGYLCPLCRAVAADPFWELQLPLVLQPRLLQPAEKQLTSNVDQGVASSLRLASATVDIPAAALAAVQVAQMQAGRDFAGELLGPAGVLAEVLMMHGHHAGQEGGQRSDTSCCWCDS